MAGSHSTRVTADRPHADTWPWRCLDCGTTIYHDGERCRDCDATRRRDGPHPLTPPPGFVEWVRRETARSFLVKVLAISTIELALTAIWLWVLLAPELGQAEVLGLLP